MISQASLTNFATVINADILALQAELPSPPPGSFVAVQTQVPALLTMLQTSVTSGVYPDTPTLAAQGNAALGSCFGLDSETAPSTPVAALDLLQNVNNLIFSVEQDINSVPAPGTLDSPSLAPGALGSLGHLIRALGDVMVGAPQLTRGEEPAPVWDPSPLPTGP